jgi:hypothetical protein
MCEGPEHDFVNSTTFSDSRWIWGPFCDQPASYPRANCNLSSRKEQMINFGLLLSDVIFTLCNRRS